MSDPSNSGDTVLSASHTIARSDSGRPIIYSKERHDYDGKSYHELALYFQMTLPRDAPVRDLTRVFHGRDRDDNIALTFKWHRVDSLESIPLLPSFLQRALNRVPETTEHIVHRDAKL